MTTTDLGNFKQHLGQAFGNSPDLSIPFATVSLTSMAAPCPTHSFRRPFQDVKKLFRSLRKAPQGSKTTDINAERPSQQRSAQSSQLHNTLPEILLLVFEYLDTASLVVLQSTCRFLRGFINIDPRTLNECVRWVAMCCFEIDVSTSFF